MPDLIIKPAAQSGNKVIIQDQAGGAVITTADSGATMASNVTGIPAAGITGVLPVGVTGGSGLDAVPVTSDVTTFARWSDFNGHGSTDTCIMKWSDEDIPATNSTVVTVSNTATNGFKVTANMNCFIFWHIGCDWGGGHYWGVSKNSNQLTTALTSITSTHIMMYNYAHSIHVNNEASWSGEMASGDVCRAHSGGAAGGGNPTRSYISVFAIKKF
jgi:hypothetical protein